MKKKTLASFRVFEILHNKYGENTKGLHSVEKNDHYLGNEFGVNLFVGSDRDHFGIDERQDARLVGLLRVTKWKNKP